jgi:nucleoside-diphosphate-sugar epimerase
VATAHSPKHRSTRRSVPSATSARRSPRSGKSRGKVLVTGGGGYIGCVLVRKLLSQGCSVRVLDSLYWGREPLAGFIDQIELIQGDIRDIRDEWLGDVDAVVHLAGLSNDPTAEYDPEANWQMNALGTERLAAACKRVGVPRLTFGSSCSIYDGLPIDKVFREDQSVNPKGAYSEGKHYAENRLLEMADDRFCPVILRQGTVFGFSSRMRYDLVVNTFVKDAMSAGRLQLHGQGRMWRPLVDVGDVADAHIACLRAPASDVRGEIFNVVLGNYQIRDLAVMVRGVMKRQSFDVRLVEVPAPPRVRDYRCSNAKMTRVLGFTPRVTIPASIANMISWITSDGYMEFDNPRFYNTQWMELLKERAGRRASAGSVSEASA